MFPQFPQTMPVGTTGLADGRIVRVGDLAAVTGATGTEREQVGPTNYPNWDQYYPGGVMQQLVDAHGPVEPPVKKYPLYREPANPAPRGPTGTRGLLGYPERDEPTGPEADLGRESIAAIGSPSGMSGHAGASGASGAYLAGPSGASGVTGPTGATGR